MNVDPGEYLYRRPDWDRPVWVRVFDKDDTRWVSFNEHVYPTRMSNIPADALFEPVVRLLTSITVTPRGSDIHVHANGDKTVWACGVTEAEAIGRLIRDHGFGIRIERVS